MHTGLIDIDEFNAIAINEFGEKSLVSKDNNIYSFREIFKKEELSENLENKLKEKKKEMELYELSLDKSELFFKIIYVTFEIIVLLSSLIIAISLLISYNFFGLLWFIPSIVSINSLISDLNVAKNIIDEKRIYEQKKNKIKEIEESLSLLNEHIKDIKKKVNFKEDFNIKAIENAIKKAHGINISNTDTLIYTKEESQKMAASQNATRKLLRTNPKRVDK